MILQSFKAPFIEDKENKQVNITWVLSYAHYSFSWERKAFKPTSLIHYTKTKQKKQERSYVYFFLLRFNLILEYDPSLTWSTQSHIWHGEHINQVQSWSKGCSTHLSKWKEVHHCQGAKKGNFTLLMLAHKDRRPKISKWFHIFSKTRNISFVTN